ncbi:unnamed protein product [Phaedon cochleariae]|uniref:Endonuclease/exonuclease/phosphatase domain-containing protein n=1 Tax=Phaedon cochleariae TaxID=80249 RepID=A0A9N9X5K7_PHACE|nr:unnamed protein product [Phaedon cochleariae]
MEVNGETLEIAHLRENEHTGQCDLTFFLRTEVPDVNLELCEEIKAVRGSSDTVISMIDHIKNKLQKIIQDKLNASSEEEKENQQKINIPVRMKRSGKDLKENTCVKNLLKSPESNDPIIFEVFSQKYVLLCNTPLVKTMKLLRVFYVGYVIQPIKFFSIYTDRNKCIFTWSKSLDKIEWEKCGSGYTYLTTKEDVNHFLKLTCKPVNTANIEGPIFEVISDTTVEEMEEIPNCPFETRHLFTKKELAGSEQFRVVSYNILAERYTSIDDNYSYCSPKYIVFDYRKQLLWRELSGFNADIICLQEVDSIHYHNYLKPKFKEQQFSSTYNKKGNSIPEGLACFFRKSRFRFIEANHIVYGQEISKLRIFKPIWELVKKNEDVKTEFMRVLTSLQVLILQVKGHRNKHLLVANTHLYYHPEANHIRLLQATMATAYINMLKKRYAKSNISVIFCGDFNSNPSKSLFPFMIQGKIHPSHEDCLKISPNGRALLHHDFYFDSACETSKYTNYTPDYKGCLDYIFIENGKLSIENVVPLPDEEELSKHEGLPNKYYPSDHLPLVVDLKFKLR